jgi:hypothetical protein
MRIGFSEIVEPKNPAADRSNASTLPGAKTVRAALDFLRVSWFSGDKVVKFGIMPRPCGEIREAIQLLTPQVSTLRAGPVSCLPESVLQRAGLQNRFNPKTAIGGYEMVQDAGR